jgi:GTP cyclohydrolase I
MSMRGVRKPGSKMVTLAVRGGFDGSGFDGAGLISLLDG